MRIKNYSKEDILDSTLCGVEFEFFSKLKDTEVAKSLSKELGKKIVIPYSVSNPGGESVGLVHSPIVVTANIFKIEPDFSGGKDMFELITGPLPYSESRKMILKVLNWIDKYGYTTDRCSIHLNLSFDKDKIKYTTEISSLNILKFVLSFDEDFIYDKFPIRRGSVYARTIKSIIPNDFFFYTQPPADLLIKSVFNVPNEKYFGVNFSKLSKGYLEFRYIGGKNYEKKSKKIFDSMDHMILSFFNVLNSNGENYNTDELEQITNIYNKHKDLVLSFNNYTVFADKYPDIKISVDLRSNEQIIKTFWERIKKDVFDLIVNSNMEKGNYNFDTDTSRKQIANTKLLQGSLRNYDIISCEIEGYLYNCNLYDCHIAESRVIDCRAVENNEFNNSKLQNIDLSHSNVINDCYIENLINPINGEVNGGIIRKGLIGSSAKISKETKIVEEIKNNNKGTKPPKLERCNLKWFKSLK